MILALVAALVAVAAGLVAVAVRWRRPRIDGRPRAARILVPFTGGALDQTVLNAAIRIARAEDATLVPAYLIVVPLERAQDAPMQQEVTMAMPLLEAVEHAALRAGVPVDARVESGARRSTPCSASGKPNVSTGSSFPRPPGGVTASRPRISPGCSPMHPPRR